MNLVEELLPNMRRVMSADRDLRDLSLLWTMIESSSAIGCPLEAGSILPTLSSTRVHFADLQQRLVDQLGRASLAELSDELRATAQCSIDILVRNLFERTADVGFLATDEVLSDFCCADDSERATELSGFVQRLAEYRAKYTVYDDIIVLNTQGQVLARLDQDAALQQSTDPVIAQALSRTGFVERFGPSDLASPLALAPPRPALLYAHQVRSPKGQLVGVLVLRFRFADELERIFDSVVRVRRAMAVVLIDKQGHVLVSNDEAHVPLGAKLQQGADGELALTSFAGREYLTLICPTNGYQGYMGPGWRAMAMTSLGTAFRHYNDETQLPEGVALDNNELRQVQAEVEDISRNLRLVVWNGRLSTDLANGGAAKLKAVLQQVSHAGARVRERCGTAIRDLYRTSLSRTQQQSVELARLAADIMDRNLYERANDCRWWALSPVLQSVLEALHQPGEAAGAAVSKPLNEVLNYINGLYTVYTRLLVFDVSGQVVGLSNDNAEHSLIGQSIDAQWLKATLALSDSQRYAVSPFEASAVSDGVPTYVYLAAVRNSRNAVVGGVAIVFNAEREFRAMLDDVLGERDGFAAFVDEQGRLLSSTHTEHRCGQVLDLPLSDAIAEYESSHVAVSISKASGYREFKLEDGYDNQVRAVVCLRLGALERRRSSLVDTGLIAPASVGSRARPATTELALFQVGASRYALPVSVLLAACPPHKLVRVQRAGSHVAGMQEVTVGNIQAVIPVICARSLFGVSYPARQGDGVILVMADPARPDSGWLGFRVDDVTTVLDIDESCIQPAPPGLRQHAPWLSSTVRLQVQAVADGRPPETAAASGVKVAPASNAAKVAVAKEVLAQLLDFEVLQQRFGRRGGSESRTGAALQQAEHGATAGAPATAAQAQQACAA